MNAGIVHRQQRRCLHRRPGSRPLTLVGDHGGVIECESQQNRTTFRVLMPAYPGATPPEKDE